jgi:hypothetical protein
VTVLQALKVAVQYVNVSLVGDKANVLPSASSKLTDIGRQLGVASASFVGAQQVRRNQFEDSRVVDAPWKLTSYLDLFVSELDDQPQIGSKR